MQWNINSCWLLVTFWMKSNLREAHKALKMEWKGSHSLACAHFVRLFCVSLIPEYNITPSPLMSVSANSSWLWLYNRPILSSPHISVPVSFRWQKTTYPSKTIQISPPLWSLLWFLGELLAALIPHSTLFIPNESTLLFNIHLDKRECETQITYDLSRVTELHNVSQKLTEVSWLLSPG